MMAEKRKLKIILIVFLIASLSFGIAGIVTWQIIENSKPIEVEITLWYPAPFQHFLIIVSDPHPEETPVLEVKYTKLDYVRTLSRYVKIRRKDNGKFVDDVKYTVTSSGTRTPEGQEEPSSYHNEAVYRGEYTFFFEFNSNNKESKNYLPAYMYASGTLTVRII